MLKILDKFIIGIVCVCFLKVFKIILLIFLVGDVLLLYFGYLVLSLINLCINLL